MSGPVTVLLLEPWGELAGGGQRSLLEIVAGLDARRYRPVVACGADGSLVAALRERGITVEVVPMPSLRGSSGHRTTEMLAALIERERVQLIHANSVRAALYGLRAARAGRVPVLAHARVLRSGNPLEWLVDQYLAWRCSVIVANSQATARRFRWCLARAAVRVVHNGIDPAPFAKASGNAIRTRIGAAPETVLVGLVGMLEPRKGHAVLLEAFVRLALQAPHARLVFAGSEPPGAPEYRRILEQRIVSLGLSSRVSFLGWVDDVPSLMAALDVCVLPVVQPEGFGRTLIEAGAAGRPVIASRLGGIPEVVEHQLTGLLVPPGDVAALADALSLVLDDPALRARLGEAGRRRVQQRFTIETMLTQLMAVYDELTAGRSA